MLPHLTRPALALCCLLAASLAAPAAHGVDRLVRHFETGPVRALAEDSGGLLWIGTDIGLFSMDQDGLHQVTEDPVIQLAVMPDDALLIVAGTDHRLDLFADGVASPVLGPDGKQLGPVHSMCAADGDLWVIQTHERVLWRRSRGTWSQPLEGVVSGPAWRVSPAAESGVIAAANDLLWHISDSDSVTALGDSEQPLPWVKEVIPGPSGGLIVQAEHRIWELRDGTATLLAEAENESAGRGLVRRGSTVWAIFLRQVLALHPEGFTEVLPSGVGMPRGGSAVLVDREDSLWIGGLEGLFQLPAPETVVLTPEDGLPLDEPRHIGLIEGGAQVTTWTGRARMIQGPQGWSVDRGQKWERGRICEDANGFEYVMSYDESDERRFVLALEDGLPVDDSMDVEDVQTWRYGCAAASAGGIWLIEPAGVFAISEPGTVTRLGDAPAPGQGPSQAVEDDEGRLWVAFDRTICSASGEALRANEAEWDCDDVGAPVTGLTVTDRSAVWAATAGAGVLQWGPEGWHSLPASAGLSRRLLRALVPSSSGGTWIVGSQVLQRVDGPDADGQWSVLEDLTEWHGVPASPHYDLAEEADGGLWIASGIGVIHVPASARQAAIPAPILRRRGVRLDGVPVPVEELDAVEPRTDQLEVELSVRSRRAPDLLRYRFQPASGAPWRSLGSRPGTLLADLSPGQHLIRLNAQIEGSGWGDPVELSYRVLPPWYLRRSTFVAFLLVLAGLGFVGHRARLGILREALEMREQVARDVHDELKPELGAMVLLAGQLQLDGLDPELRRELAARIEAIGVRRQSALSDTEWALTTTDPSVRCLIDRIDMQAQGLFSGAADTTLELDLTRPMTAVPLSLPTLVSVQRIAAEAMHNVARHAGAQTVLVRLAAQEGRWQLTIEDDGRGVHASDPDGDGGLGLDSMQRRARAIGAALVVADRPDGGTSVSLTFDARRRSRFPAFAVGLPHGRTVDAS